MGKYDEDADEVTTKSSKYSDASEETTEERPAAAGRVIKRGWGAAEETKSADSPFAQRLKVSSDAIVIKFLEDDPYTSYRQHWIERQGQKSFTCTSSIHSKGCPLCDAGDRPSARFCFNVALLISGEEPVLRSYEVGPRVVDTLKNFHQDPKMGPLPKHYWAVSKTGKAATSQTNHQMVKGVDLEEDWDLDPITDAQLAALKAKAYSADIVSIPSLKTLQQIAAEELGD
jgi:hypothetical protein